MDMSQLQGGGMPVPDGGAAGVPQAVAPVQGGAAGMPQAGAPVQGGATGVPMPPDGGVVGMPMPGAPVVPQAGMPAQGGVAGVPVQDGGAGMPAPDGTMPGAVDMGQAMSGVAGQDGMMPGAVDMGQPVGGAVPDMSAVDMQQAVQAPDMQQIVNAPTPEPTVPVEDQEAEAPAMPDDGAIDDGAMQMGDLTTPEQDASGVQQDVGEAQQDVAQTDGNLPGQVYASAETAAMAAEASTPTAVPSSVKIETLLEECIRQKASDIHIQVGLPPILRVDGSLTPIPNTPSLTADMVEKLVFATLDSMQRETLSKDKEFDYSFSFGEVARFRVNAFNERGNLAAAFRLIPSEMPTIDQLGMPQVVTTFADYARGLVLVTGPTGSGKSTTLAALINKINTEKAVHIITVEDPIEFTHRSKRSVVVQREVHYDTFSFARALKSILREDPDVVLVGEMRDLETISAAITIAETGHLVFATLHTNSAAQSIDRMIDVFPAHQQPQIRSQLSNILMAICAQRLVPAIDGGRVVAAEIMVANPAVRSIIREGKTHQLDTTIQTGASEGMQTMDRTLAKLVQTGVVTYDSAHEFAVDPKEFERLVKG